jgi:homoserine dehydrogenase
VPVIKVLRESLAAAQVQRIFGIVNGTTNYVLSAMTDTGAAYDDVLKKAQALGFAEADPTEDVGGKDAAAKMAILSSIAFHSRVTLADVQHEGITAITATDIAHARAFGYVIKLLGVAKLIDGRMNVRVYPAFLPKDHPLAGVKGAYNAVFLESGSFDKIMLFGPGAGSVPTASAVVGDIISIVNTAPGGFVRNCTCYKDLAFYPSERVESSFYLRLQVEDKPGVLGKITAILGEEGVSIRSVVQTGRSDSAELVMVLHPAPEAAVMKSLARVGGLADVQGSPSFIRVEGEDGV